jgi:hypothetical protein
VSARRLSALLLLLAPFACTTSGSNYPYLPATGTGGTSGTGTAGTGMVTPTGDVMITITSPADGTTVSDSTVLPVTANVTDTGTDLIDTSSVKVTLAPLVGDAAAPVPASTGQLTTASTNASSGSYSGTISIGTLPTGSYLLTVTAQSTTGVQGKPATVTLTIAGGPTLIVNSPTEGQPESRSVSIEILVGSGAMAPTARLAGMDVTLTGPMPDANGMYDVYTATATFDPTVPAGSATNAFGALTGPQLLDVKETDGTATSEVQRTFVIDTAGPSITSTAPPAGPVIGGVVTVSATVTDPSGVLDSSVIAVIGDESGNPLFTLQLAPQGGGVYSTLFDTRNLTQCYPPPSTALCIVYPTISFRASDSVGNQTSLGYDLSVDNIPPIADLDPPLMRQMRLTALGYECSALFDPLAVNKFVGDMPNDLCEVPQVFDLRARIEDDGNRATGLKVVPLAGIDPNATNVYVLTDTTKALIVDSDGDGWCDEINPNLSPTTGPLTQSDQVLKIRLAGVTPAGGADFYKTDYTTADLASLPSGCLVGSDLTPPKRLCGFEQPTIAIGYTPANVPAVWSVEPIDNLRCLGNQLDTKANNIPDGQWICIAVASADLAGSMGVSTPMRVWVNYNDPDPGAFCVAPPANAGPPPSCTGTYDPTSMEDAVAPCKTVNFATIDKQNGVQTEVFCLPGGC